VEGSGRGQLYGIESLSEGLKNTTKCDIRTAMAWTQDSGVTFGQMMTGRGKHWETLQFSR
jgi:imidazolonepropionase-like amidohydrolase